MKLSKIEWTDHTFNPWSGCTKVSDGCKLCYAESMEKRFKRAIWGPRGTRRIASEDTWKEPLKWDVHAKELGTRPRVFSASMSDLFEDETTVPEAEWHKVAAARQRLFDLIDTTPNLDWLILTKRPENIRSMWPGGYRENVWLGTSVEDSRVLDRVGHLVDAKELCRLLFLSVEPMIGPVEPDLQQIGWVICGGESGAGARFFDPAWAINLRTQCVTSGVHFFMKQMGRHGNKDFKDFTQFPSELQLREFPLPRGRRIR